MVVWVELIMIVLQCYAAIQYVRITTKKEQKQVKLHNIKRFLKINLADVWDGSMTALADKIHQQEVPCTQ